MTTETETDPRLVCLACGWEVDSDGRIAPGTPAAIWHVDELCIDGAWACDVLEALEPHRPSLTYMARHGMWECMAWSIGTRATAPTPHEAVFALATKIGRSMEANQ